MVSSETHTPAGQRTLESFGYAQELNRSVSTVDLLVYGLVFMVPIAPWAIFGTVYNSSSGMVPLVYVIGLVAMVFTALAFIDSENSTELFEGLFLLAVLVDGFWLKPHWTAAAEIRLQRQCFGLSPMDRRRLQWEIEKVDEAPDRGG